EQVEDAAERLLADRDGDRAAGVAHLGAALEAVGGVHGDRAHAVVAEVLLDLADQLAAAARPGRDALLLAELLEVDLEGVVDLGEVLRERGLDHDALDLLDPPRDPLVAGAVPVVAGAVPVVALLVLLLALLLVLL